MKSKIKIHKRRDPMAYDLLTNGVYRPKVVQSKKVYNRKRMKKGKDLLKYLSPFCVHVLSLKKSIFKHIS